MEGINWGAIDQAVILEYARNIAIALVILVVTWIVSNAVKGMTVKALQKSKIDSTVSRFLGSLIKWGVMLLGVVAAMGRVGIETTSFAAAIAGASLAIGMALSGSLGNFAAGIMLLVFRPFKAGDVVSMAGVTAKVTEITMFATILDTADNRRIILPNNSVFGATIENATFHTERRVDVAVGTDYSADLDKTREVLEAAAGRVPGRLSDRDVQVVLAELGASSVDWSIRVWAKTSDFFPVREATIREVKLALDEAGIGIPFPQMDVHMDKAS